MTTNHTPATPLPWDGSTNLNVADILFAQHASNSYPAMVELLRVFAFADWCCDCTDQGWWGEGHTTQCPQGEAQDLLRSIGELS